MKFVVPLILILFSHFIGNFTFAGEPFEDALDCHTYRTDVLHKIFKSKHEQEIIGNILLDGFLRGATVLENGARLDATCFTDNREKNELIKSRLNRVIKQVSDRSQKCFDRLGFKEFDKISGIFNNAVFLCAEPKNPNTYAGARAVHVVKEKRGIPHTPFQWEKTSKVSAPALSNKYGYMFVLKKSFLNGTFLNDELLAYVLAHEALHVLKANQRDYHSNLNDRKWTGCDKSVYSDYIYFSINTCFSRSPDSDDFYKSAANCDNVCMEALTEIDQKVTDDFGSYLGPSILFEPYDEGEAKKICENIKKMGRNWDQAP